MRVFQKKENWMDVSLPLPSFTQEDQGESLIGFILTLIRIDDQKMKSVSGYDGFVYLKFVKYLLVLLFGISFVGAAVFIPIYSYKGKFTNFSKITGNFFFIFFIFLF